MESEIEICSAIVIATHSGVSFLLWYTDRFWRAIALLRR